MLFVELSTRDKLSYWYNGTLPNDHLVINATLFWLQQKLSQSFSHLKNPFNMTTQLIRPVFHGLKVVALTGFHCTCYNFDS